MAIFNATGATTSAGAIRLQNTNANRFNIGITTNDAFAVNYNNNISQSSDLLRITSSGNVGIGVINPAAKLEVAGGVKADSIKLATAAERWYAIPHPEFVSQDPMVLRQWTYTCYDMSWSTITLYASVNLPHGASILEFQAVVQDTVAGNISVELGSVSSTGTLTSITTVTSTAAPLTVHTISSGQLSPATVVDNQNNMYLVQATWQTPPGWGTYKLSDVRLYSARIKYTITSPLP